MKHFLREGHYQRRWGLKKRRKDGEPPAFKRDSVM
jgi:hypothetical protein